MDAVALPSYRMDIEDQNASRSSNKNLFRLLKLTIFACCLTGFGLQTVEFLGDFYKYPVVVSQDFQRMEAFPMPAFTFCSKYWYDFKQYCQEFPDNCETTEYPKKFCNSTPEACERNTTHGLMPTTYPDHYFDKDILRKFAYNSSIASSSGDIATIITGPFFIVTDGVKESCFASNIGFGSNGLRKTKGTLLDDASNWYFEFIPESLESEFFFKPEAALHGTMYVHSPLQAFRKDDKSLIFKEGNSYSISIRLSMKRFLPHPYETDCEDYELSWKKNNNTGPVSREMCESKCSSSRHFSYFENSMVAWSKWREECKQLLDGSIEIEKLPYKRTTVKDMIERCKCMVKCKKDCWTHSYDFIVTEDVPVKNFMNSASILVIFEKDDVPITYLKPKYNDVDLFIYIGGLMGCWLGMSLWTSSGILGRGISALGAALTKYKRAKRAQRKRNNTPLRN